MNGRTVDPWWMTDDIKIPYFNKKDQERIERVFRRIEHLEQRVEGGKVLGEDKSYDRMEISGLRYVLKELAIARTFINELRIKAKELL